MGSPISLPRVDGGFKTILADPPWSYHNGSARLAGGVDGVYGTMTIDEIRAMPVSEVAAKDAVLLLWATNPLMPEAMSVIDAWGFRFKTMRTWVKTGVGVGYWLRGDSEHILVATRGKPKLPERAASSVFHTRRERHSAKPREVYPWAESMGEGPRLELFARERRHGWVAFGNQLSATAEADLGAFS